MDVWITEDEASCCGVNLVFCFWGVGVGVGVGVGCGCRGG
jgi:hypothetical protein